MGKFLKGVIGLAALAAGAFFAYNVLVPPERREKINKAVNSALDVGEDLFLSKDSLLTTDDKLAIKEKQERIEQQWIELGY